jgi:hypothetical protein
VLVPSVDHFYATRPHVWKYSEIIVCFSCEARSTTRPVLIYTKLDLSVDNSKRRLRNTRTFSSIISTIDTANDHYVERWKEMKSKYRQVVFFWSSSKMCKATTKFKVGGAHFRLVWHVKAS